MSEERAVPLGWVRILLCAPQCPARAVLHLFTSLVPREAGNTLLDSPGRGRARSSGSTKVCCHSRCMNDVEGGAE